MRCDAGTKLEFDDQGKYLKGGKYCAKWRAYNLLYPYLCGIKDECDTCSITNKELGEIFKVRKKTISEWIRYLRDAELIESYFYRGPAGPRDLVIVDVPDQVKRLLKNG